MSSRQGSLSSSSQNGQHAQHFGSKISASASATTDSAGISTGLDVTGVQTVGLPSVLIMVFLLFSGGAPQCPRGPGPPGDARWPDCSQAGPINGNAPSYRGATDTE